MIQEAEQIFLQDPLDQIALDDLDEREDFFSLLMPVDGRISSLYGWRRDPIGGVVRFHNGIDFSNMKGIDVLASADGEVKYAGWGDGCGKMMVLDHGNRLETRYCHLSALGACVRSAVRQGDVIGRVGESGRATGPHLHFEVWQDGTPVDPALHLVY